MNEQNFERQEQYYKEKARAWEKRYEEALTSYCEQANANFEGLVDLIWEKGILEHVSPSESEEHQARQVLQKDVFDRDDVRLYWRLLYSIADSIDASTNSRSVAGGFATQAVVKAVYFAHSGNTEKILPAGNAIMSIDNALVDKAKQELVKRGVAHPQIIPLETKGTYNGIPVTVDHYTSTGLIALEANEGEQLSAREAHMKLGELTRYTNAVRPEELVEGFIPA